MIMKIEKIWFEGDCLYGLGDDGKSYCQSLLWYHGLRNASDEERNGYVFGMDGIHWRHLDEDVSFDSFTYEDAMPSPLQRFFLTHKEINIAEFTRKVGIAPLLLRNYINGFRKPNRQTEEKILKTVREIGKEYIELSL